MFSQRMQQLRTARGLNKRQTATLLEMPYTTYNNYENGIREPGIPVLKRIADVFGVTVDYLIGQETVAPDSHPDWQMLWNRLDDDQQQEVIQFIEFKAYQGATSKNPEAPYSNTMTVAALGGGVAQRPLSAARRKAIAEQTRKMDRKQSKTRSSSKHK